MNRPIWTTIIVITLLCTGVLVASGIITMLRPIVIYPSITPASDVLGTDQAEFIFPFEDARYRLRMPVDAAVYTGARDGSKSAILYREIPDDEWIPAYYLAFIDDPHQEALYTGLLSAFFGIRDENGLDSDRYLEMITSFVQSIPYEDHPGGAPPKFPVETVAERTGDCDDKSLLLAALLSRAGYDVALLNFIENSHMGVGVAADGGTYGSTGYAFIETTDYNFVGVVPDNLANGVRLTGDPQVIRVGNGTVGYMARAETAYIMERSGAARAVIDTFALNLSERQADLKKTGASIASEKETIEKLLMAGDIAGFTARIQGYNSRVETYNQAVAEYAADSRQYDRAVEAYNYIAGHRYDRKGTFAWLLSSSSAA